MAAKEKVSAKPKPKPKPKPKVKVEEEQKELITPSPEEGKKEIEEVKPEKEGLEERIYTIPLRRAWIVSRRKRTPKAVKLVRDFVLRHMKAESIVISNDLNEELWSRGIQKPPRRIRVKAEKDKEGVVTVYPAEARGD
jgi:large subunit ribosomal protein L31e